MDKYSSGHSSEVFKGRALRNAAGCKSRRAFPKKHRHITSFFSRILHCTPTSVHVLSLYLVISCNKLVNIDVNIHCRVYNRVHNNEPGNWASSACNLRLVSWEHDITPEPLLSWCSNPGLLLPSPRWTAKPAVAAQWQWWAPHTRTLLWRTWDPAHSALCWMMNLGKMMCTTLIVTTRLKRLCYLKSGSRYVCSWDVCSICSNVQ